MVGQLDLLDTEAFLVINFRYHLVSLTAVFFALAIGLIVGTAALNGPAANDLNNRVNNLSKTNSLYRSQVISLNSAVNSQEKFATEAAPQLLANKLTNRRVLLVSMQGTSSSVVTAMQADLGLAGAKVTGLVEIQDRFVDPSNSSTLLDLAESTLNFAQISGLPTNNDGVETSSALLAAGLVDHVPAITVGSRGDIVAAYRNKDYITVNGTDKGVVTDPAEAVVFLVPPPFEDQNASDENQDMITIVSQFRIAGPLVVGSATASGSGNVIGAVTSDASLSKTVSTVDNVSTVEGQVAAVLALNEQLQGKAGHYGQASSATSLLPKGPQE
jgi:hypothetical protein